MSGACTRGPLLIAALCISMLTAANSAPLQTLERHHEAVDERSYPWSAVGKLFNETGTACSGVVISHNQILTAAHCLFNARSQRIIPPAELHFLVGYRTGRYSVHARIARYEIGAGFDPLSYQQTFDADWAVLTVTETLPLDIEPLRLRRNLSPSGTKAVLVGYPRDRPFAMTADRDCELEEGDSAGRLLLHTCRSMEGYSGGPILVHAGNNEMQVAGIQIASVQRDGTEQMIAVPVQAIWSHRGDETTGIEIVSIPSSKMVIARCEAGEDAVGLEAIRTRLDLDQDGDPEDIVSSIPERVGIAVTPAKALLPFGPFAVAVR